MKHFSFAALLCTATLLAACSDSHMATSSRNSEWWDNNYVSIVQAANGPSDHSTAKPLKLQ